MNKKDPAKISTYVKAEKFSLIIITITGIFYNFGMTAGPWFEGQLAQCLYNLLEGMALPGDMFRLAALYVGVIFMVQLMRFFKRLYVRKFANNINRSMKLTLYRTMVHRKRNELLMEGSGSLMTKAISDVDACVEGIRKFTTEVFDTGVVMIAYFAMLCLYDVRLAFLCMIFPPMAYMLAELLKKRVTESAAAAKAGQGRLNAETLDRVTNALTYRVYGQEARRDLRYDACLKDYEKLSVKANVWENAMQPIYQTLALLSTVLIIYFGGKNVMGTGWRQWNIAAFSTFLSCYLKLAVKTGKAAKLFNAVQKASVSWKRIHPFMKEIPEDEWDALPEGGLLSMDDISFSYPDHPPLFSLKHLEARAGEIIGITGEVACGKSAFGKLFLGEEPYMGSIKYDGQLLGNDASCEACVSYLAHQPELFAGSLWENVSMGMEGDVDAALIDACMDVDLAGFPDGKNTMIGSDGLGLSGGQKARLSLARTLYHRRPILVLDDPCAAVDMATERTIFENLRKNYSDCIIFFISHRLTLFPKMDRVLWIPSEEGGEIIVSDHDRLIESCKEYRYLYRLQSAASEETGTDGGDQA